MSGTTLPQPLALELLHAHGLRAFLLAACAVMVLSSCDFAQDKDAAATYAERYFAAATLEDVSAVLPLYSPRFFAITPRDTWLATLQQLRDRCGAPSAHNLVNWAVTRNVGTNPGTTVRLIYEVRHERCRTTETMVIFRPPDGGLSIIGHFFQMNGSAPAGSEKTTLEDGTQRGRGEASGVFFLGEQVGEMAAQIEAQRGAIERGLDRDSAQHLLPAGGARNALDCALWDLEARRTGKPVWALAGLPPSKPLLTTFTLGAEAPEVMAAGARRLAGARALKVKLTGDLELDAARVAKVRAARPDVWLGVDANQGYTLELLPKLTRFLADARVELIEQPVARGHEAGLENYVSSIPIAADESALVLGDIAGLVGRFDVVNIKLDKCGGLTEGLAMAHAARRLGLKVMVGNMMGTSLAMAPAFVLGQLCDIVDLDGPTFLKRDRVPGVRYSDGMIECDEAVWGSPRAA